MRTLYKTVCCPRCKEDYLYISLNKSTGKLYLNCCECEASWHHPDDVGDTSKMFVDVDIDGVDPTKEEIEKFGWSQYITNKFG